MTAIAYLGNFGPAHSTENHVARAFTKNGYQVYPLQENDPASWRWLRDWATHGWRHDAEQPDFVLWTRTWVDEGWQQHTTVDMLHEAGIVTVGFHLDRWWGLSREHQVTEQPFFRCRLVVTADGGHDDRWLEAGVNHRWLPPGVSEQECLREPSSRHDLDGCIVFVGSWDGYHPEWGWRRELVQWLRSTYGDRFVALPAKGGPSIRGQGLVDVYAADAVFVGDSCLAGGATRYWSDRIPETIGRGGLLVHPWVDGLDEHFVSGEHLLTYRVGDVDQLRAVIDRAETDRSAAQRIRTSGRAHVLAAHTYEVRARQLVRLVDGL